MGPFFRQQKNEVNGHDRQVCIAGEMQVDASQPFTQ